MNRTEPVEMFIDTQALLDVIAERERQQAAEGWSTAHDDEHNDGSLAKAAACYALCAGVGTASARGLETHHAFVSEYQMAGVPLPVWPWEMNAWKPKNPRRDLVRSAALILAEIERLDRLAPTRTKAHE